MSKVLARLLNKSEAEVAKTIGRLEQLAGFPSEDARLVADTALGVRLKIAQIGLDPDDTTGPELFHALSAKFQTDSVALDKAVGYSGDNLAAKLNKAAVVATAQNNLPEVWALKLSIAKKLLKGIPPKKTMKLLGYRSVDSLLKRTDPAAVILGSSIVESASWHKQFSALAARLTTADFELRQMKIINLDVDKWVGALAADRLVVSNTLVGALALWPGVLAQKASVLTCALFLSEELQKSSTARAAETLSPYPSLRFWQGAEHLLAWNDGQPVSLNLHDSCLAQLHNAGYDDAVTTHAAYNLYKNLLSRYAKHIDVPEEFDQIGYRVENALAKLNAPAQELANEFAIQQEVAEV